MMDFELKNWPERELVPGFQAKLIHTERTTIAFVRIAEGSKLPPHSHFHEQTTTVLEGELELTVGGEVHLLRADMGVIIAPNVVHSARALADCRVVDVFSPVRDDYK